MNTLVLALSRDHGLTEAEAHVIIGINHGFTLAEIALQRGVSVHTVRNQAKAAIAKTESRRQADLSRLVETLRHRAGQPTDVPGEGGRAS